MLKKELLFQFNNETLLIISEDRISFLSLLRLKQYEDMQESSKEKLEKEEKERLKNLYMLGSFDKGGIFKKPNYGVSYKVISYQKKLSKLQEYILKKESSEKVEDRLVNDLSSSKDILNFREIKNSMLEEEVLNMSYYQKEDYLSVRTDISLDFLGLSKNEDILKIFKNMSKELYEKYRNNIDAAYQNHLKNYNQLEYDKTLKLEGNDLLELLSKLSLTNNKTIIYDMNFFQNNLLEEYRQREVILKIYSSEMDIKPKIIEFSSGYLCLKEYGKEDQYFLTSKEEQWHYEVDRKVKIIKFFKITRNNKKPIKEVSYFKFEEEFKKESITTLLLTEIPADFSANISKRISTELKKLGINEFTINTEIVKLSNSTLIKDLDKQKKMFDTLPSLKNLSFNNRAFDIDLAIKKSKALSGMIALIEDGESFANIRLSVNMKTDYKQEDLEKIINNKFSGDIILEETEPRANELNYPFVYSDYNFISEKIINLSIKETDKLIDLEYGEKYFSGRNEKNQEDLAKINDKHAYVLRKDQLQSINLFDGPDAFNTLVIAASGGGKSFMTVNILDSFLSSAPENLVWIIDRGGSYKNFASINNGNNINIKASDSLNCINPFSFTNYFAKLIRIIYFIEKKELTKEEEKELFFLSKSYFEKFENEKDSVILNKSKTKIIATSFKASEPQAILEIHINIVKEMIGYYDLSIENQSVIPIAEALTSLIAEKYNKDLNNYDYLYILPEDIKKRLLELMSVNNKESLLSKIDNYISTALYGNLFNNKPSIDLENRLINIDFEEIQNDDIQNLVLTSLLSNFFNVMTSPKYKKSKKIIVIDEAHAILNAKSSIGLKAVAYLFRTARKYGALAYLISQNITDFAKVPGDVSEDKMSDFAGIISNSGWKFLLKAHDKKTCIERLSMSEKLATYVDQNQSFKFVVLSKVSGKASLVMSDLDYAIATTHKEEKNLLDILSLFIMDNNNNKKLILFSILFSKDFRSNYGSVSGFNNANMGTVNKKAIEEKLDQILMNYNKKMNRKKYIKMLNDKLEDNPDLIKTVNSILIEIINKDIGKYFFDIIFKKLV